MKSIVLLGASRAGKSTFAGMLSKELKSCQIISGDLVRLAYRDEIYKNKNIKSSSMKEIPEYRNFLKSFFDYTIKYDNSIYTILDTVDFKPKDYKLFENCLIIVFGYPKLTKEDCLNNWRTYIEPNDWALHKTDEELLNKAQRTINESKQFLQESKKYNLKFVDTSFNRKKVLNDLLTWTKNKLEKS